LFVLVSVSISSHPNVQQQIVLFDPSWVQLV